MKKFLNVVLILAMILVSSFVFTACKEKEEDKFYETTNQKFSTFIQTVCLNEKYFNGVKYGNNIQTILNNIENNNYSSDNKDLYQYEQLNEVYDQIFVVSFKFLSQFDGIFINVPQEIPKNMKKNYLSFEKSLESALTKLNDFDKEIDYLDQHIVGIDEDQATSIISLQLLKNFKRAYIDISQTFIELSNQFLKLCETYIYPSVSNYIQDGKYIELTETQITNQKTLANLKSAISIITPAIKYLNSFNGEYEKVNNEVFFETLNNLSNLNTKIENSTNVKELNSWQLTYNAYCNDLNLFNKSLEKVSMQSFKKDYNYDIDLFTQANIENLAYINKIIEFSSQSITTLFNSVYTICN